MMLKLLDRYLLDLFMNALLLFLMIFIGLSVLVDFVTHLDDLLAMKEGAFLTALKYFLYKIPIYLYLLLPPITLFATIFAVARLMVTNELVPILTAGISVKRIVLPFLMSALIIGGTIMALDELVLPRLSERVGELEGQVEDELIRSNVTAVDRKRNYLYAERYEVKKRRMDKVTITLLSPYGWTEKMITAHHAQWDKKSNRWYLYSGSVRPYAEGVQIPVEDPSGAEPPHIKEQPFGAEGMAWDTTLQPVDIANRGVPGAGYMTFSQILKRIEDFPYAPTFWTRLHQKLTYPLSPVILILIGLPFVVRSHAKGIVVGLIQCLILTIVFYALTFGLTDLGNKGMINPILASWLPTLLLGSAGTFLFLKRTD